MNRKLVFIIFLGLFSFFLYTNKVFAGGLDTRIKVVKRYPDGKEVGISDVKIDWFGRYSTGWHRASLAPLTTDKNGYIQVYTNACTGKSHLHLDLNSINSSALPEGGTWKTEYSRTETIEEEKPWDYWTNVYKVYGNFIDNGKNYTSESSSDPYAIYSDPNDKENYKSIKGTNYSPSYASSGGARDIAVAIMGNTGMSIDITWVYEVPPPPSYEVGGCFYNKNTGEKISRKFSFRLNRFDGTSSHSYKVNGQDPVTDSNGCFNIKDFVKTTDSYSVGYDVWKQIEGFNVPATVRNTNNAVDNCSKQVIKDNWGSYECQNPNQQDCGTSCNFEYDPKPQISDCTDLKILKNSSIVINKSNLTVGDSYSFSLTADPKNTNRTHQAAVSILNGSINQIPQSFNSSTDTTSVCNALSDSNDTSEYYSSKILCNNYPDCGINNPTTVNFGNWTPTTPGTYTVFGRVWNDGISQCRSACVDTVPNSKIYPCESGITSCKFEVQVKPKGNITCNYLNLPKTTLQPGESMSISANVTNQPNNNSTTVYKWNSINGKINIISDSNCNPQTKNCELTTEGTYNTEEITYTAPNNKTTDNILFTLNNDESISCSKLVSITNAPSCNVTSSFDKANYNVTTNTTTTAVLTLNSNQSLTNYSLSLYCPSIECKFETNNLSTYTISSITANIPVTLNVLLNTSTSGSYDVSVSGSSNGSCSTTSSSIINSSLSNKHKVNMEFVKVNINNSSDYHINSSEYCEDYTDNKGSFDTYNKSLKLIVDEVISPTQSNQYLNKNISNNDSIELYENKTYNILLQSNETLLPVQCTMIRNDKNTISSTGNKQISNIGSEKTLVAIVGPKAPAAWWQAFGGSIFARNGLTSSVNDGNRLLESYNSIKYGVVSTNSSINVGGNDREPKVVIKNSADNLSVYQGLKRLYSVYSGSNSSLSSIDFNSSSSKFYFVPGDLKIDTNKKVTNGHVPIVFVNSNITISKDVDQIDMLLITKESNNINIEYDGDEDTIDKPITVNGGLISGGKINLDRLKNTTVIDPLYTFYYRPEIYFTNFLTGDNKYFFERRVYTDIID